MSELEEKLGTILSNPQMMQQIMNIAKMVSAEQPTQTKGDENTSSPAFSIDPKLMQAVSGIASQSGMDPNQKSLLKALNPYLSQDKIRKLERAMGAARMANAASAFLGSGGLSALMPR